MSVPVLSRKQRRKSLSGLKKRPKGKKNILAVPDSIKISDPVIDEKKITELTEILERLLPRARLPVCKKRATGQNKNKSAEENEKQRSEIHSIRKELLIGINAVSSGVTNDCVSCVLFADDIRPKLLINHLIILCSLKNIPFLYMPGFRNLTKNTMGFSCIVLGFKKNFTNFLSVIDLVNAVTEKRSCTPVSQDVIIECDIKGTDVCEEANKGTKKQKPSFTYLYRTSTAGRVFLPDPVDGNLKHSDENKDFIELGSEEESNSIDHIRVENASSEIDSDEGNSLTFTKLSFIEKFKQWKGKNRAINKKEYNEPVLYSKSRIMKVGANPNRDKKKFQKLKKRRKNK